jgi:hypothetical protein
VKDSQFRNYTPSKEQSRPFVHIDYESEDIDQLNLIESKIQPVIAID